MKKILTSLILVGFVFLNILSYVKALENPNYTFLEGGQPRFQNTEYDFTYSDGDKTLTVSGSLFPSINNSITNFKSYYFPLSNESNYKGLSGWNGIIFIEPKKLQPGRNKIMWSNYNVVYKDFITNEDKSPMTIFIDCTEEGNCTLGAKVGNNYTFDNSVNNTKLRNRSISYLQETTVQNFDINNKTSLDFFIYVTIEISVTQNDDIGQLDSRIKLTIDTETEPGSGKLKKPTQTTRLTSYNIGYIVSNTGLYPYQNYFLFLNGRNVYSINQGILQTDIHRIKNKFGENSRYFESYYTDMKLKTFEYLLDMGFSQIPPTITELDGVNPATPFPEKIEEIPLKECDWNEVGCHISNIGISMKNGFSSMGRGFSILLGMIGGKFKQSFDWVVDSAKEVFIWLWQNIKPFLEPIVKPIYDFIMSLIEEAKIIFEKLKTFFEEIFEIIKNLFKGRTDPTIAHNTLTSGGGFRASFNQEFLCSKDYILMNRIEEQDGFIEYILSLLKSLFSIASILDPIAPTNGTEICTYEGVKELHLRKNSFIDIIIVMIFSMMSFLIFYKVNNS